VAPRHLLGSPRSPLLGIGSTYPSCHSLKLTVPFQYERKNAWSMVIFAALRALNASGGMVFSPGAFPLVSF